MNTTTRNELCRIANVGTLALDALYLMDFAQARKDVERDLTEGFYVHKDMETVGRDNRLHAETVWIDPSDPSAERKAWFLRAVAFQNGHYRGVIPGRGE